MLAFWDSILEYIVNCLKMVHHVTALTATAVANNLSCVRDDDIPYSSKFLWSNIFVSFVNYTEITKNFATKISLHHP